MNKKKFSVKTIENGRLDAEMMNAIVGGSNLCHIFEHGACVNNFESCIGGYFMGGVSCENIYTLIAFRGEILPPRTLPVPTLPEPTLQPKPW